MKDVYMWDGRWVFYADEISGNLLPGIIEMCGMEYDVVWFVMHELRVFSLPRFHPELIHSKPENSKYTQTIESLSFCIQG